MENGRHIRSAWGGEGTVNIFWRRIYDTMLRWKAESNGRTALLIEGARRTGKTVLAEQFARMEYRSCIIIDFSSAPAEVRDLFDDITDPDYIFFRLQSIYQVRLFERESAIVFDDVQKAPLARQAIKYLVKDRRYDYIEAGCLIAEESRRAGILIPGDETKVQLFPLDYEEFRRALGDSVTVPLLRDAFRKRMPLGDGTNSRLMRDFRIYLLVGGMPKAVDTFLNTNNLGAVDEVKREIISCYEDDLLKMDGSGRACALFGAIPLELGRRTASFEPGTVIPEARPVSIERLIRLMNDSMAVNAAYSSEDPGAGLALTSNPSRFRLFAGDTGLFITLAFRDRDPSENPVYRGIFDERMNTALGFV